MHQIRRYIPSDPPKAESPYIAPSPHTSTPAPQTPPEANLPTAHKETPHPATKGPNQPPAAPGHRPTAAAPTNEINQQGE